MTHSLKRFCGLLGRLARDDRGAEGLEKVLIIAAIVIPLLAILLFFRDYLVDWLSDSTDQVRDDADVANQGDPF